MTPLKQHERIENIRDYGGGLTPSQWEHLEQQMKRERRAASGRRSALIVLLFTTAAAYWATRRGYVGFAIGYSITVLFCIAALVQLGRRRP